MGALFYVQRQKTDMAQIKSGTPTAVQGSGQWKSGQYGTFDQYEVQMDNGDVGEVLTKEGNDCPFKIGQQITYEYSERTDKNGVVRVKMKKAHNVEVKGQWPQSAPAAPASVSNTDRELSIVRQSSLKAAVDCYNGGAIQGLVDLVKLADAFVIWVQTGDSSNVEKLQQ